MGPLDWMWAAVVLGCGAALIRSRNGERRARRRLEELEHRLAGQEEELARLRENDERARHSRLFGGIGTWDWLIDQEQLHWSDEVYRMFGFEPGEVTPSYSLFCRMVHPDDAGKVREGEMRCVSGDTGHDEEYRIIRPDGAVRWLRETGNVLLDDSGRPYRMVGVVRDVTDEKEHEQDVLRLAYHDPLTGLPNQLGFSAGLKDAVIQAARREGFVGLALVEITALDAVRERHGLAHSEEALKTFAARLSATVGPAGQVARLDTALFAVMFEDIASTKEAAPRCDAILAALLPPLPVGDSLLDMGARLGGSVFPTLAPSVEGLMHCADLALMRSKAARPAQAVLFPASSV